MIQKKQSIGALKKYLPEARVLVGVSLVAGQSIGPAGNTGTLGEEVSLDVALVATSVVHDELGDHGSPESVELIQDRPDASAHQADVAAAHPVSPAIVVLPVAASVIVGKHNVELVQVIALGLKFNHGHCYNATAKQSVNTRSM